MQSAEQLVAHTIERLELSDFGGDTLMIGLQALIESIECDADSTTRRQQRVETTMSHRLENRLRVEAGYAAEGAGVDDAVEGPLSIMGLPRTGTTAVGNVMSLDPQFRPLRVWEQLELCPPPVLEREHDDPRRIAYIESTAALHEQMPELAAMHLYDTDATAEDVHLLGLEFRSQEMTLPVFAYRRWWREADMRDAYRYHRRGSRCCSRTDLRTAGCSSRRTTAITSTRSWRSIPMLGS